MHRGNVQGLGVQKRRSRHKLHRRDSAALRLDRRNDGIIDRQFVTLVPTSILLSFMLSLEIFFLKIAKSILLQHSNSIFSS